IKRDFLYEVIDLSDIIVDMKDLKKTIKNTSLKLCDEFTMENYPVYEGKQHILVAVIDSIVEIEKSGNLLVLLEDLGKTYFHKKLYFLWVEGNLNMEKKKMFGIQDNAPLPQIAFFRIDYISKIAFPYAQNLKKECTENQKNLRKIRAKDLLLSSQNYIAIVAKQSLRKFLKKYVILVKNPILHMQLMEFVDKIILQFMNSLHLIWLKDVKLLWEHGKKLQKKLYQIEVIMKKWNMNFVMFKQ
ncbi:hypothetical protein IMG5_085760, partial [Ichthyophthirius multifiliis]